MPLQHPEQIERMDVGHRPGTGGEPLVAARHFEEAVIEVLHFLGDDLLEGGAVRVLERGIGEQNLGGGSEIRQRAAPFHHGLAQDGVAQRQILDLRTDVGERQNVAGCRS
jgi:hypothetical protein